MKFNILTFKILKMVQRVFLCQHRCYFFAIQTQFTVPKFMTDTRSSGRHCQASNKWKYSYFGSKNCRNSISHRLFQVRRLLTYKFTHNQKGRTISQAIKWLFWRAGDFLGKTINQGLVWTPHLKYGMQSSISALHKTNKIKYRFFLLNLQSLSD